MRKAIFITAIALSSMTSKAQETAKTKLKLYAANAGIGVFGAQKDSADGLTFLVDATFSIGKNLIMAAYEGGSEFTILDGPQYQFNEFSLSYGRESEAAKWLRFEGFVGVGYYNQNITDASEDGDIQKSTISFPLRLNTKFYFNKRLGVGLCTNYSINNLNCNLSENITFHYRFN